MVWQSVDLAVEFFGEALVACKTDEGFTIAVLERQVNGAWVDETGEATYSRSYYMEPKFYVPLTTILPTIPNQ